MAREPLDLRPLPRRVRPMRFETVASYADRLRAANGLSTFHWNTWFNELLRAQVNDEESTRHAVLEAVGGLLPGHFERQASAIPAHPDGGKCLRCTTGLDDRMECRRCSLGAKVAQLPHDGSRVCSRHGLWIGPGTCLADQVPARREVVLADRRYRELRGAGRIDAHRLAELLANVDYWADAEAEEPVDAQERFRVAVDIAWGLARQSESGEGARVSQGYSGAYEALRHVVETIISGPCVTLVDATWWLLRTSSHLSPTDPHRFAHWTSDPQEEQLATEVVRTCRYPRALHNQLSQFVSSEVAGTRYENLRNPNRCRTFVCHRGHVYRAISTTVRNGKFSAGCGYCANKKPLAGFNTVADLHPDIAAMWDYASNGGSGPTDFVPGSSQRVYWTCAAGHRTLRTISSKCGRGVGCGVCSTHILEPAINSLAATHPDIAREWHPALNGDLDPADVTAGNERTVWWLCAQGHDYTKKVSKRARGSGCNICRRTVAHRSNCLRVTHPAIARQWRTEQDEAITPDQVLYGSRREVWWVCDRRHEYKASIYVRVRGTGCPYCARKKIAVEDSMLTTHPALARELHPSKNGELNPGRLLATTTRLLWWMCAAGHEWRVSGASRVRFRTGCPTCSNRRLLVGYNDLATTHPEVAAQWNTDRNEDLLANDLVAGAGQVVWWVCERGHEWRARVVDRAVRGSGCRRCPRPRRRPSSDF